MTITNKTKTKDVLPLLLNKDIMEQLIDKVDPVPLEPSIMGMTIAQFADVMTDEEEYIKKLLSEKYALVAFGKIKSFRQQMDMLVEYLKGLEIKLSAEEQQASVGIDFPDVLQRMLLTVSKFFNYKSFDEAENCKISDYLLIAKDQVADVKYQRNYQRILDQKAKSKKKK